MTWYSQSGEDRIVADIFSKIGTTNQVAVEFGALDGWHNSNTAHFRELGWTCHLWDSGPIGPLVSPAVFTADNVNAIFAASGVPYEFDLLSIDIDGNDLWVWKALTYRPRVVIMEYNPRWGIKKSRTVPYDPARKWDGTQYYGASIKALARLGKAKGYTLTAATRSNVIFGPYGLVPALDLEDVQLTNKFKPADPAERQWLSYP